MDDDSEQIEVPNPLAEEQREKSGSTTFEKYDYQYHWALDRILTEHSKAIEYAVFMECHEDVVLADSLCGVSARFEFNQVKAVEKPQYTIKS
ncbi:dsDNA nuclease domain-containing protein, partial [Zooshikella harenae]